MTYVTDADRQTIRDAPAVRCVCGHWSAVHVKREGARVCTANRCRCDDLAVTRQHAAGVQS